jgi:hypothetical protein
MASSRSFDEVGPAALLELGDEYLAAGLRATPCIARQLAALRDLGVVKAGAKTTKHVTPKRIAGTHGGFHVLRQLLLEAHEILSLPLPRWARVGVRVNTI